MESYKKKLEEFQDIFTQKGEHTELEKNLYTLCCELYDEYESAWSMLDELKRSEIESHASKLKAELQRKIDESLIFSKSKVVDA
jgi:hypothetical protein